MKIEKYNYLFLIYGIFYLLCFSFLEKHIDRYMILNTRLDNYIPFCKYFIIPYLLWFVYIFLGYAFFFTHDQKMFTKMALFLTIGMTTSLLICAIFPNGLNCRPVLAGNDIFERLCIMLYNHDTPTNVFPSIHVYNAIGVTLAIQKYNHFKHNHVVHISCMILCVLIILSTLFLKQHCLYDVFGSILMATIVYRVVYQPRMRSRKGLIFQQ